MARGTTHYWNPSLETLPRQQLAGIPPKRSREILAYAKTHSASYQHRHNDIYPECIRALGDVRRLPLIHKEHLMKIRGVLFTPVSVEELVRATFPQMAEHEIIVQRKGIRDEISLKRTADTRLRIERKTLSQVRPGFPMSFPEEGGTGCQIRTMVF